MWRRFAKYWTQHPRPRLALGIARDMLVLYLLFWSIGQGVAWKFWLAITLACGCFVYDVRLMWIRAGEELKRK